MPAFVVILVIAGIVALWWVLDPPTVGADILIVIRQGRVTVTKGHLRPPVLADVRALIETTRISRGHITVSHRRVSFSRTIPRDLHQRLRNVLLNP